MSYHDETLPAEGAKERAFLLHVRTEVLQYADYAGHPGLCREGRAGYGGGDPSRHAGEIRRRSRPEAARSMPEALPRQQARNGEGIERYSGN